jgi:hypothetical protein
VFLLHDAFDVGIDQLKVIEEIVRLTSRAGRFGDCLAALEVKVELLELQAQQAMSPRQGLLLDQVVGIRRYQSTLAKERLNNPDLAWQYLEKAHQRSPGDPLLLPDLMALAEAQGRAEDLADLLSRQEESVRFSRGEDRPPLGLWLKRAMALRLAGQEELAAELEQRIVRWTPKHLLLHLAHERRLMQQQDIPALIAALRSESAWAAEGLKKAEGSAPDKDPVWATDALLSAASLALSRREHAIVAECLQRAEELGWLSQSADLQRQHDDLTEGLLRSDKRWSDLATWIEKRRVGAAQDAAEHNRLSAALLDLYLGPLKGWEKASQLAT